MVLIGFEIDPDRTYTDQHIYTAVPGGLYGRNIAIKDNICTADYPTTCASSILNGFRSPSDATVVHRLRSAGAVISGKTNMDEFGMGSHSVNSANGPVRNISS